MLPALVTHLSHAELASCLQSLYLRRTLHVTVSQVAMHTLHSAALHQFLCIFGDSLWASLLRTSIARDDSCKEGVL